MKSQIITSQFRPKQEIKKLSKIAIIITLTFLLIGSTIQNTVLQFWIFTFPDNVGGPYFILSWTSLLYTIFFGVLYAIQLIKRPRLIRTGDYIVNYTLQGLFNSLFGFCMVYSAPIERTPPIIFSVLINFGIIFGMIFTKFLIKQKRSINYFNASVGLCMSFMIFAVGLTIIGEIFSNQGTDTQFNWTSVFWIFVTILGTSFGALYNVLQQRYLKQTNPMLDTQSQRKANILKTCFWTSLLQLMFMLAFFWIDLIPGFGFSSSITSLVQNYQDSFTCFLFGPSCEYLNFVFGVTFTFGYIITFGSMMVLNKQSANFSIYSNALQTPLSMLVFIITGLGTTNIPLWSVIPSIFLIGTGIFIWKKWEIKQSSKRQSYQQLKSLYSSVDYEN